MTILKDIDFRRTNGEHPEFVKLVADLDRSLAETDGDEHDFYHRFNGLEDIKYVVVAYQGEQAVGCGAIKKFNDTTLEVKRMFTLPDFRGKGIASKLVHELEHWAKELGYTRCILETGLRQPDAIALYEKNLYTRTENYGQYIGMDNSACFEKVL